MKRVIQNLAHRLGYHISRDGGPMAPFKEMQRLCADTAKPVIFDVGAYQGQSAQEFRKFFPSARIFSFEPFPESFAALRLNTTADPSIRVFNHGFTDHAGTFALTANSCSATNSLLPTDELGEQTWGKGWLETKELVPCQFKTIDAVLAELGIQTIDILKLDVQGAEHLVLKGAAVACRDGLIGMVYSEIITQPTYMGQKSLEYVLNAFFDAGFDLHNLYNLSSTADGKLRQVDALFTHTKRTKQNRGEISLSPGQYEG